jgi:ferritin
MASITEKIQGALNQQINAEMYSTNLYLSMSAYFEAQDLPGFGHWMRVQADEENLHVTKLFDYIIERGGRVILKAVAEPPVEWKSPLEAFEATLAHEEEITTMISDLVGLSHEAHDRASESFLRWFVDEQVEEEASVDRVLKMLRLGAGEPVAMLMLDREMASRPAAPAVPPA